MKIHDARDNITLTIHHFTRHLCEKRTLWEIQSKTTDQVTRSTDSDFDFTRARR